MSDHTENLPAQAPPGGFPEGLFSDPEMIKRIGAVLGGMLSSPSVSNPSASQEEQTDKEHNGTESDTPSLSAGTADGIASLLSNPAFLQQLPQLLSLAKPLMSNLASAGHGNDSAHSRETSAEACRNNLLLALKPFLSKERRRAVDSIIGISRLGAVFQQLK